jgi:hypothetical protein
MFLWNFFKMFFNQILATAQKKHFDFAQLGLLLLLGFSINQELLVARIHNINLYDEVFYIENALRVVTNFTIPPLSQSPLSGLFYGIITVVAENFEHWVLISLTIGRTLIFSCLIVVLWRIGKVWSDWNNVLKLTLPLLCISYPIWFPGITNPGYNMFILSNSVLFYFGVICSRSATLGNLFRFNVALCFCIYSRPDLIFLLCNLCFAFIIFIKSVQNKKASFKIMTGTWLPIVMLLISIFVLRDFIPTKYGLEDKSYTTFMHSQILFLTGDDAKKSHANKVLLAEKISEKKFGSREDNRGSVFLAISRNPLEFFALVKKNLSSNFYNSLELAFGSIQFVYSETAQPKIIWVFLAGIVLGMFLLVICHPLTAFFVVCFCGSLSIYLVTLIYPVYLQLYFVAFMFLFSVGFGFFNTACVNVLKSERIFPICFLGALIVSMIYHNQYNFRLPTINDKAEGHKELARFLSANFTENYPTLAYSRYAPLASKAWYIGPWPDLLNVTTKKDFDHQMIRVGADPVIVVEPYMMKDNIYGVRELIDSYTDDYICVFSTMNNSFKVLLPNRVRNDAHKYIGENKSDCEN